MLLKNSILILIAGFIEISEARSQSDSAMTIFSYDTTTLLRPEIFSESDITRMKRFLINNASKKDKDKDSVHQPGLKLNCINTCRAAAEILLFDSSYIPITLRSSHPVFNINRFDLRASNLMDSLNCQGLVADGATIRTRGIRSKRMVSITDSTRLVVPVELEKSVWHTIMAMIGGVKGFSVFAVSLCDDYHAALITVDHRQYPGVKMYWSDQTHKHLVRLEDKILKNRDEYGWERMGANVKQKSMPRQLDAYILYAMKRFWCDCGRDNQTGCCFGHCFPIVKVWRLRKPDEVSDLEYLHINEMASKRLISTNKE